MSIFSRFYKKRANKPTAALPEDYASLQVTNPQTVGLAFSHLTSSPLFPYLGSAPDREQFVQAYVILICSKLLKFFGQLYPNFHIFLKSGGDYLLYSDDELVAHNLLITIKKIYGCSNSLDSIIEPLHSFKEPDLVVTQNSQHAKITVYINQLLNKLPFSVVKTHANLPLPSYNQCLLMLALKPYFTRKHIKQRDNLIQRIYNTQSSIGSFNNCIPNFQQTVNQFEHYSHHKHNISISSVQKSNHNEVEKLVLVILADPTKNAFLFDWTRAKIIVNGRLQAKLSELEAVDSNINRQQIYTQLIQQGFYTKQTAQMATQLIYQKALMSIFSNFTLNILSKVSPDELWINQDNQSPNIIHLTPISACRFRIAITTQRNIFSVSDKQLASNKRDEIFVILHLSLEICLSADFQRVETVQGYFNISHSPDNQNTKLVIGHQAIKNYNDGKYDVDGTNIINEQFNCIKDKFAIGYQYE